MREFLQSPPPNATVAYVHACLRLVGASCPQEWSALQKQRLTAWGELSKVEVDSLCVLLELGRPEAQLEFLRKISKIKRRPKSNLFNRLSAKAHIVQQKVP